MEETIKEKMDNEGFTKKMFVQEASENCFNMFFKRGKSYIELQHKKGIEEGILKNIYNKLDKRDIIIISPNYDKINQIEIKNYKKSFLPYDKIFIEYPIVKIDEDERYIAESNGILLTKLGEEEFSFINKRTIVCATIIWTIGYVDFEKNVMFPSNIIFKEDETGMLNEESIISARPDGYISNLSKFARVEIIQIIKKVLKAIETKEYTSYKKWTPSGMVTKEIVYSHDVKTHKRHFWLDSGRFKIPLMSKEELERKGYGIDELVFKNGELRRDVPYKIIGQFKVGVGKKPKEENRIIRLFKRRILKQEEKVFRILREIFPDSIIKRHDRKVLHGLELDFLIYDKRIAFEYDGEQHFDRLLYNKLYGFGFDKQQKRDRLKDKLCIKKKIKLIRIKYDEKIIKSNVIKKLNLN